MDLLPDEVAQIIPPLYAQEHVDEKIAYVKYTHPLMNWDWYILEYDPVQRLFFGFVAGDFPELGYFSLDEFISLGDVIGVPMERDLDFKPMKLSEILTLHGIVL